MKRFLFAGMLVSITAVWGWTFSVVKDAVAVYGVIAFLALRFTIGALSLGAISAGRVGRRSLFTGGGIGLALALGYLPQTLGLRHTTASNCGLITGLFVVAAPLVNRLLFGVKVRPLFFLAAAVSMAGLYLLTGAGTGGLNAGDLFTLGAAVSYGLHIALLDRYAKGHEAMALAFAQTASAAVLFAVAWPLCEPLEWPSRQVWIALAITGMLATAVAFTVQTYVQQRLSAAASALILSAEPVFAVLFGCLLLGETLGGVQVLGMALMIGAIVAAQIDPAEHPAAYPLDPL